MGVLWFLAIHGVIVSFVVLAVGALPGLLVVLLVRRRREANRARAEMRLRMVHIDNPRPGPIATCGVVRELGEGGWVLDCDGERVRIAGTPKIVLGTRARWRWRDTAPLHTVSVGDAVIARGLMAEAVEGHGNASHRLSAREWVLSPSVETESVELCALRPVSCPRALGPWRIGVAMIVLGAAAWWPLRAAGNAMSPRFADDMPRDDAGLWRILVSAMMPGVNERALDSAAYWLENRSPRTLATVERRIWLAGVVSCEDAVMMAIRYGRDDEAIELANGCGHPAYAIAALGSRGDYEEAAKLLDDPSIAGERYTHDRGVVAIAAGRWKQAAAIADQLSRDRPRTDPRAAECVAALLRARAGLAAAFTPPNRPDLEPAVCEVVGALLQPVDDRARTLEHVTEWYDLGWSYGGRPPEIDEHDLPDGSTNRIWLAPFARAIEDSETARSWMVWHELVRGDLATARASLPASPLTALQLASVIALAAGTELPPWPAETPADWDSLGGARRFSREGTADPASFVVKYRPVPACNELAAAAVPAAAAGNGDPLADFVARCDGADHNLLLVAIARTKSTRLAAAYSLPPLSLASGTPAGSAWFAARQRDVARIIGDRATAERMQAQVDKQLRVLGDRDRLEALLLWSRI